MARIGWVRRSTGRVTWLELDGVAALIWSRIDARGPDECWPWTASCRPKGYGQQRVGGAAGSTFEASRLVYALVHGEAGPGLVVRHSCDNPPCCNPAHLLGGTMADNTADMIARGRQHVPELVRVERTCVCGRVFLARPSGVRTCGRRECIGYRGWVVRDSAGRFTRAA